MVVSTSPLLADRTEGSQQAGGAERGGFGHASLVPAFPGSPQSQASQRQSRAALVWAEVDEFHEVDGIFQAV